MAEKSQEEEEKETEIMNEKETTRSLTLNELHDMQIDFSCHQGEHVISCLLRCWDSGANSQELDGKDAQQLESLARD